MRQHKVATSVTAAGLALAVAAAVVGAPGHARGAAPRVPGFTLPALGHPGEHVSLAAYAGRPVVVNFFASWCVPCKKETPLLARFFGMSHGRIVMIGVDVNDAMAAPVSFVRKDESIRHLLRVVSGVMRGETWVPPSELGRVFRLLFDQQNGNGADDPFATFGEWSSEADRRGYAGL